MKFRKYQLVIASVLIFIVGLSVGIYYQREILVLLQHSGWRSFFTQPTPGPSTPLPATASSLSLSTVPEPIPLIFSETLDEPTLQEYLKQGAVVLPLGRNFGEPGNMVVTAHSSGTAAFGPYRFAFAKLSELKTGEEFSIAHDGRRYTYRVYGQEIVWPHQVDRLPNDDRSTVTLVTCWPLWTNFKRLLVHAELVETEYR